MLPCLALWHKLCVRSMMRHIIRHTKRTELRQKVGQDLDLAENLVFLRGRRSCTKNGVRTPSAGPSVRLRRCGSVLEHD